MYCLLKKNAVVEEYRYCLLKKNAGVEGDRYCPLLNSNLFSNNAHGSVSGITELWLILQCHILLPSVDQFGLEFSVSFGVVVFKDLTISSKRLELSILAGRCLQSIAQCVIIVHFEFGTEGNSIQLLDTH